MIGGVLVLAAGKSTRIAGVTGGGPKPLLPIRGQAILARNLEWLAREGIQAVWINLHHEPDQVRGAIGDGRHWGLQVRYSPERDILGTAGAWKHLEEHWTATSLVVYGDNLLCFSLDGFLRRHRETGALATLALFDPARHPHTGIAGGHVAVQADGRIASFVEGRRPPGGGPFYVNTGAYLLEPEMRVLVGAGFQDFAKDVFPPLVAAGRLFGHVLEPAGYCLGVDTPESLRAAEALIDQARIVLT